MIAEIMEVLMALVAAATMVLLVLIPVVCVELAWTYRGSNLERCFDEMDAGGRLFSACIEDSMPQPLKWTWNVTT